ncbi:hypothetical protein CEXT_317391 [Caerostris extrusa]|uniref:Uncharacterized protein n=1 Tax=Caerostris extrusa TaxID=172846 RepID=A0AAV4PGF3_CAEEX|nr:hypothetical protein CEXT_317391 [Caerostris extrusa]
MANSCLIEIRREIHVPDSWPSGNAEEKSEMANSITCLIENDEGTLKTNHSNLERFDDSYKLSMRALHFRLRRTRAG